MRLFEKLFCKHKWKSHNKEKRQIFNYHTNMTEREFTREILICECCGKIKTLEY